MKMESPTPQNQRPKSQLGGRRSVRPPSSQLHSDCPPEHHDDPGDSPSLRKRSVSLTTLQPIIIQPRMAQLETLEAKMASIEVSLSNAPRRRKNGTLNMSSFIRVAPKDVAAKELETFRNALRDKENIIQSLKGQLTNPGVRLQNLKNSKNMNNLRNSSGNLANREMTELEKKHAEEKLAKLKVDIENKRLSIKNLKTALARLDVTDNIDLRIQQAEIEYQLGREELSLLTLLEGARALQLWLEESKKNFTAGDTLYSCVKGSNNVMLFAVEVTYDPKSPKFGARSAEESQFGLWIDWALQETGLVKDDRLLEVNGKTVLNKSLDDLNRLLSAAPDPAQIVVLREEQPKISMADSKPNHRCHPSNNTGVNEVTVLRKELEVVREQAEEAQRTKDDLKADNVRLTHRISYLEEQVSELLNRKSDGESPLNDATNDNVTNINITPKPPSVSSENDVQVFQKGPRMTAVIGNHQAHTSVPVRSKSSMSNVSNTHIPAPTEECQRSHRQKNRNCHRSVEYYNHKRYQHHWNDGKEEVNVNTYHVNKQNRNYTVDHQDSSSDVSLMEQNYKKATRIVKDLTGCEKHHQKCIKASQKYDADLLRHYNVRKSTSVLDFRLNSFNKPKLSDSKSAEELASTEVPEKIQHGSKFLNFDSDTNSTTYADSIEYISEASEGIRKPRPTPPKKPVRLYLHKNLALQSSETLSIASSGCSVKGDQTKTLNMDEIPSVKVEVQSHNQFKGAKDNSLVPLKWSSFGRFK